MAELYQAVLSLRTPEECRQFFTDLCTPGELEALSDRWLVARLVQKGLVYRRIQELTGVSTATVTRVARALEHGEGGYPLLLSRCADQNADELRLTRQEDRRGRRRKVPLASAADREL